MAKRIFINNLNTYVSQAILAELRNDVGEDGEKNPDANQMFGTYIDKDSSIKPDGVQKMLKVSINRSKITTILMKHHFIEIETPSCYEISL